MEMLLCSRRVSARARTTGRVRLLGLLVALIACLTPTPSRAKMMHHYDLTSLALMSDAVVLAWVTGSTKKGYLDIRKHEVLDVYAGELKPGDVVEAHYGSYTFDSSWGAQPRSLKSGDPVVLFLGKNDRERPDQPDWWLAASGLRIFIDGVPHRFEQWRNPGPYQPVPQGRDPYDVMGDLRGQDALTQEELIEQIKGAVARAQTIRMALEHADTAAQRQHLLEFIGPAWGQDDLEPYRVGSWGFYADEVALRVLSAFAEQDDFENLLEGVSRIRGGVDLLHLRPRPEPSRLLAAATDRGRPTHQRVAALQMLDRDLFATSEVAIVSQLVPLLKDTDPRVRQAAAEVWVNGDGLPEWGKALRARIAVETDRNVLFALAKSASDHERLRSASPRDGWPVVAAERRGRALHLMWADAKQHWSAERVVVMARPERGDPIEQTLLPPADKETWMPTWGGNVTGGTDLMLLFDSPLPEGPVELEVSVRLENDGGAHEVTLPVRTLRAPPEERGQPPKEPPRVSAEPKPTSAPPPGCGCDVDHGGQRGAWMLLPLLVLGRRSKPRGSPCKPCVASTLSSRGRAPSTAPDPPGVR